MRITFWRKIVVVSGALIISSVVHDANWNTSALLNGSAWSLQVICTYKCEIDCDIENARYGYAYLNRPAEY